MWNTLPTLFARKSTHHYVTLGLISVKVKTREYIWMFYDTLSTALKRENFVKILCRHGSRSLSTDFKIQKFRDYWGSST